MSSPIHPRVLAIGEVLWDLIRGQEHIGGAPFNLAAHLARLGCEASILTRIGSDSRGEAAIGEMKRLGVETALVQIDSQHPTGWAKVELSVDGVPTFSFPNDPAYNFIEADDQTLRRLAEAQLDAICFGTLQQKGSLHPQRSRRARRTFFVCFVPCVEDWLGSYSLHKSMIHDKELSQ
jgi:fructokinase